MWDVELACRCGWRIRATDDRPAGEMEFEWLVTFRLISGDVSRFAGA